MSFPEKKCNSVNIDFLLVNHHPNYLVTFKDFLRFTPNTFIFDAVLQDWGSVAVYESEASQHVIKLLHLYACDPLILWHFELQRTASMNHPLHPANQPQQRIVKLGFWSLEISTTWVHIGVKSFLREYLLLFFLVWNLGEIFTIQRLYLIYKYCKVASIDTF